MRVRHFLRLIFEMSLVELKQRYNGTILGYFWSLLNPFLMLVVLYSVFSLFADFDIENYQLYLLLGIIVWNFVSESTNSSITSLVNKKDLLRKFNFPSESIIVSSNISSFITFVLNFMVFLLFSLFFDVSFSWTILLVPIYFLQLFFIILGLSLFLSSIYVKLRDVFHLWSFILLLGFFITPIMYPVSLIPINILRFYMLNPFARIIVDLRDITLFSYVPDIYNYLITLSISLFILVIGLYVFRAGKKKGFVEYL